MSVEIDGSRGEGGGQILRTSLALSMITGKPLRMRRIRAGRAKPGLQRQHLACVEAAAQLCGAGLSGVQVGSQQLDFTPGKAWLPELDIDIGSAGSATLVIQTFLVPAIVAGRPLHAVIVGGTHNPMAPPFDFLDRVFVPHLRAMGADITLSIERVGVMPRGGGRIVVDVAPGKLRPIQLVETGDVVARRAHAIIAGLPRHVAERELAVAKERLVDPVCEIDDVPDAGPSNVFMVEAELGERRPRARDVARREGPPRRDRRRARDRRAGCVAEGGRARRRAPRRPAAAADGRRRRRALPDDAAVAPRDDEHRHDRRVPRRADPLRRRRGPGRMMGTLYKTSNDLTLNRTQLHETACPIGDALQNLQSGRP